MTADDAMDKWLDEDPGDIYYHRDGTRATTRREGLEIVEKKWDDPESPDHARVALWQSGDYLVSTVFLGLNHNPMEGAPPLIFETMIRDENGLDKIHRFSTEAEAVAFHNETVDRLEDKLVGM